MKLLLSEKDIKKLCLDLSEKINRDYEKYEKEGIVGVCILKGGVFFMADIARNIKVPLSMDFVKLSSYGRGTVSTGTVSIMQDITIDIKGKHVIIFDEIVDSGRTLNFFINRLKSSDPASVKVCTLIDKKSCRTIDCVVDYIGINAGPEFLIGYGLDYGERFRNLPDVYQLIFEKEDDARC